MAGDGANVETTEQTGQTVARARALMADGDVTAAVELLRRAIEVDPDDATAHLVLGNACKALGRVRDALDAYGRVVEINPESMAGHGNLGTLYSALGRDGHAVTHLERAAELAPDNPAVLCNLAAHQRNMGRLTEAQAAFRQALSIDPGHAQAWYGLSSTKRFTADDPDAEGLARALARDDLNAVERLHLCYAGAKAAMDAGDPDGAALALAAEGGRLRRAMLKYDSAADIESLTATARAFAAPIRPIKKNAPKAAPVLIVGMPRSGTTLIERMLGGHPGLHAGGERLYLPRLIGAESARREAPFPAWAAKAKAGEITPLAERYAGALAALAPDGGRVIDKLPENFRFLGLVARMLPRARIVHVRRDPADTCLSCFTTLFADGNAWSYDLEELGRFYRAYDALMNHWKTVLPDGVMAEVRYEDVLDDPKGEIGRLLAFLGLDWDERCLAFAETPGHVGTASAVQVRGALNRASVGRWKPHAEVLGPLFAALGPDLLPECGKFDR